MVEESQVALEQELLRMQMEESREALAEKIERLEEKVTSTVENATASVAEATATVMETVQTATATVSETVGTVTDAVQGTVDTVRQSVEGTVESVKGAFDLSKQVEQHPWLMVGGAVAAGYLAGTFLVGPSPRRQQRAARPSGPSFRYSEPSVPNGDYSDGHSATASPILGSSPTLGASINGTASNGARYQSSFAPEMNSTPVEKPKSDWFGEMFGPELAKLQKLAIGTALGMARDLIVDATPQPLQKQVGEVIDGFTEKLGGQCVHGDLFGASAQASSTNARSADPVAQRDYEFQR